MTAVQFNFKGLMAPVFTPFNNDERRTINYEVIDEYAKYFKTNNIQGVLVNGTTGEGMTLSKEERMKVVEVWRTACSKYSITLMVQIGGAPIADVIDLAIHAESIGVDAILCLPEIYYKPAQESDLVKYLQKIGEYCASTPFFYYHIPRMTNVDLNMPKMLALADAAIPNFCGLKYTSADLEQGVACLKPNRTVFLGSNIILSGALAMGFDSAIMSSLNVYPRLGIEIIETFSKGDVHQANECQKKLTLKIKEALANGNGDFIPSMKLVFDQMNLPGGLQVGVSRKQH